MTKDVLMVLLLRASIMTWVGLLLLSYWVHPALGAVTLFLGWLALGAHWNWMSERKQRRQWPSRPGNTSA